jgi:hypothetical protein
MSTSVIICPSGLSGEIRKLKGKEAKLLGDRAAAKSGSMFESILGGCWLRTIDTGVYDFGDGPPNWGKVLVGDRFYTLLRIRALTFGETYPFAAQCSSPACRERFEWEINLSELPVKPLPESSKAALRTGKRLETLLDSGSRVWFKLLTGIDETRAAKNLKNSHDGALLAALGLRILEIEGVTEKQKRAFLEDMDLDQMTALLDRFDEADGGVETSIEIECPHCYSIQEIDLPFGRGFFMPRTKATATAEERSTAKEAGAQ